LVYSAHVGPIFCQIIRFSTDFGAARTEAAFWKLRNDTNNALRLKIVAGCIMARNWPIQAGGIPSIH